MGYLNIKNCKNSTIIMADINLSNSSIEGKSLVKRGRIPSQKDICKKEKHYKLFDLIKNYGFINAIKIKFGLI